jgi:hypothetical protein
LRQPPAGRSLAAALWQKDLNLPSFCSSLLCSAIAAVQQFDSKDSSSLIPAMDNRQQRALPIGVVAFISAGCAACVAEVGSIPFDTGSRPRSH